MRNFLASIRNEQGATAIEFGLIAALVAVAAIASISGVGSELNASTGSSFASAQG